MKTPIDPKEILKGDLIRVEYSDCETATEFRVASSAAVFYPHSSYFLLDRPVVLPTEPGWYKSNDNGLATLDNRGNWYVGGYLMDSKTIFRDYKPLTRLMTKTEWEAGL